MYIFKYTDIYISCLLGADIKLKVYFFKMVSPVYEVVKSVLYSVDFFVFLMLHERKKRKRNLEMCKTYLGYKAIQWSMNWQSLLTPPLTHTQTHTPQAALCPTLKSLWSSKKSIILAEQLFLSITSDNRSSKLFRKLLLTFQKWWASLQRQYTLN